VADKVKVLDVGIHKVTMSEAVKMAESFIAQKTPHLIATANAEMVMLAQEDQELSAILNRADLVVPDGAGVVWAARHRGHNMPERVAGFDLTQKLFAEAALKGYRIYMFGGAPGIVEKAKVSAEQKYKGIQIVGTHNGFFCSADEPEIIKNIIASKPDILLVALGVPKQEKWLQQNLAILNIPLSIGVGGTFDVMAGNVRRAPVWMQKANIEWLYRLLSQPQRAIRMIALPRFMFRVLTAKKD
jgi:N-acetylglucosaminyldiphosphoundecaprenol N-acetyl-beta-D-mannosaminyltransferase